MDKKTSAMIPKKIHYCWFGRGEMPSLAQKCLDSWRRHMPEYELIRWDEDNFDLDSYPFAKQAYDAKKYAFVADVCRLHALFQEGGIYMDTDVEIIKPLDNLFLQHTAFAGFENGLYLNTGLMASVSGGNWIKDLLSYYNDKVFCDKDGTLDLTPNTQFVTTFMANKKFILLNDSFQNIEGYCTIYPSSYFSPKCWQTLKVNITVHTYCIHHFAGSWLPDPILNWRYKTVQFILGKERTKRVFNCYQQIKGLKWQR